MNYFTHAEIIAHHITTLVSHDVPGWYIGLKVYAIPLDGLAHAYGLVYYPCNPGAAAQAFKFLVNGYGLEPHTR